MLGLKRRESGMVRPAGEARWDPWGEFSRIRAEMDRLFSSLFGSTGTFGPALLPGWAETTGTFVPAVDLYETPREFVCFISLPGMTREDIHVEVEGDVLHISGERKPPVLEKEAFAHQVQNSYGRFDLRYTLPAEVNAEAIKAVYRNGVLEVRLPKVEAAKPKPIEVRVES